MTPDELRNSLDCWELLQRIFYPAAVDARRVPEYARGLVEAISTLDEREQCLIYKRFPANRRPTTFVKSGREIINIGGRRLPCEGVSAERARQMVAKALNKLLRRKEIIEGRLTAEQFLRPPVKDREVVANLRTIPVTDIELSTRSYNCLHNAGVKTVGDFLDMPPKDRLRIKNFGAKRLAEIKLELSELGVRI